MRESQDRDIETESRDREPEGGGGMQAGAQLVLGGGGGVSYQSSEWMKRTGSGFLFSNSHEFMS